MRTVLSSAQVVTAWARQTQDNARNHHGSLYFHGDTIYSYGSHFHLARHVKDSRGEACALINSRRYSKTTSDHASAVAYALHDCQMPVFLVPDPLGEDHAGNLSALLSGADHMVKGACRSWSSWRWKVRAGVKQYRQACAYAKCFGLTLPDNRRFAAAVRQARVDGREAEARSTARQVARRLVGKVPVNQVAP